MSGRSSPTARCWARCVRATSSATTPTPTSATSASTTTRPTSRSSRSGIQRRLTRLGFEISRYSGLAFKVIVRESDGSPRGLDVFGGFVREGTLYLMGEVGHPFRREWLEPRSEVTLAGRAFPAPHEPERLLEAMYGPGWRVPDPAYKFQTPRTAQRRLSGWFRGTRVGLDARWQRVHKAPGTQAGGYAQRLRAMGPRRASPTPGPSSTSAAAPAATSCSSLARAPRPTASTTSRATSGPPTGVPGRRTSTRRSSG